MLDIPKNSLLFDIQYVKGNKKRKESDYLYIIYKDSNTNEKFMKAIPEPKMTYYFEKEEFRDHDYNLTYQELDKTRPVTSKYKDIIFSIAKEMGEPGKRYLENIFSTGQYKNLKEFYRYPYVFGADYDIQTWYRYQWDKSGFKPKGRNLTVGFMDIETDSFDVSGFSDPATCPIDLVTVIDSDQMKSYTFALVNQAFPEKDFSHIPDTDEKKKHIIEEYNRKKRWHEYRNKKEKELMNDLDGLKEELHEMFDETYGELEYNFYFYEDEKKMIIHLFQLINELKLDFMLIWNMAFDIPYIYERLQYLGLDPKEVMCHPHFPVKECYFVKDRNHFEIKNKTDYFVCSSYTVFFCQMILYASIRKGREELRSNKLTYIAQKEIGDEKLDYGEEGNIKKLPYMNYRKYFIYNIKDVLLQLGINKKTKDTDELYITSYENITQYKDAFKQTVVLRNVQYKFYMNNGLVPGSNINVLDSYKSRENVFNEEEEDDSFEGALVGNPLLINEFGQKIYGKKTNYSFQYNIDMDMKAFYPNTNYALNIAACCLIFKAIINSNQYDVRGGKLPFRGITDVQLVESNDDSFSDDIAKEVFDNFQSKHYLSLGYKFLNLPSVEEMDEIIKEELI